MNRSCRSHLCFPALMAIGLRLSGIAAAHTLEIRQESSVLQTDSRAVPPDPIFVIGRFPEIPPLSPPSPLLPKPMPAALPPLAIRIPVKSANSRCAMPVLHFALGGTKPLDFSPKTMDALRRCGVTAGTPLVVSGYTCDLGPRAVNLVLARRRAETVAARLSAAGFRVEGIRGFADRFVTRDPDKRSLDRRVEIKKEEALSR